MGLYVPCFFILFFIPEPRNFQPEYTALIGSDDEFDAPVDVATAADVTDAHKSTSIWGRVRASLKMNFTDTMYVLRDATATLGLGIYFAYNLANEVMGILEQWGSTRFGWTLAEMNYVSSLVNLLGGLTLYLLPFVTRSLRNAGYSGPQSDLRVAFTSLLLALSGIFLLSWSSTKEFFIGAVAVYSLHSGFQDALMALMTWGLPKEHVTKLYLGISATERLSSLISGPTWAAMLSFAFGHDGSLFELPFWTSMAVFAVALILLSKLGSLKRD